VRENAEPHCEMMPDHTLDVDDACVDALSCGEVSWCRFEVIKGAGCSKRESRYSSGLWPSNTCNAQDLSFSI